MLEDLYKERFKNNTHDDDNREVTQNTVTFTITTTTNTIFSYAINRTLFLLMKLKLAQAL